MKQRKLSSRPTCEQARVLKLVALKGPLVKSYDPDKSVPMFDLAGGGRVQEPTALALIRRGWLIPQKDGLYDFDAQTYVLPGVLPGGRAGAGGPGGRPPDAAAVAEPGDQAG